MAGWRAARSWSSPTEDWQWNPGKKQYDLPGQQGEDYYTYTAGAGNQEVSLYTEQVAISDAPRTIDGHTGGIGFRTTPT